MQVGTKHTPFAVLSRPVAGVRGGTFVVTLPGSPKVGGDPTCLPCCWSTSVVKPNNRDSDFKSSL